MPVIEVSNVSPVREGSKMDGNALAVDASGNIVIKGKHGENAAQLLIAKVDLRLPLLSV